MKTGDLATWNDGCRDYLVLVLNNGLWKGWRQVQTICGELKFQAQTHDLKPIK